MTALTGLAAAMMAVLPAQADCDAPHQEVTLAGVTDALELKLEDGPTIRLAGLDFPSATRASPETIAKVKSGLDEILTDGLAGLALLAGAPDRWGRWPGVLYALDPPYESYALRLLNQGDARVRPEFETRSCASERLAAEQKAITSGLGVWADPDYGVRKAGDRTAWNGDDGRFIIVEGIVRRVGVGRSRLYLDFGARNDLSATVTRKGEAAFLHGGVTLRELKGARVRIRGVLDMRYAPRIDLVDASTLQVLAPARASP